MRVVVAMSGGVDSSVAAALVRRSGHEAVGVTLKLMPRMETGFGCCGSPRDVEDAKRVCERLGIPHYVMDMTELFDRKVVDPFVKDYLERRTPNPCVECNRSVKFGYLLALARAWGSPLVATGHYARIENGRLLRSLDAGKDQTYFLHSLTRRELRRVLFPIGGLRKEEVRRIARELGLATAEKPESMEICFVPNRDYRGFVRSRVARKEHDLSRGAGRDELPLACGVPGPIRDGGGRVVGEHRGLENFTIGQRRGVGVCAPEPLYVTGMEAETNTLYIGPDERTYRRGLIAGNVTWAGEAIEEPFEAEVRIRHRHEPSRAVVTPLSVIRKPMPALAGAAGKELRHADGIQQVDPPGIASPVRVRVDFAQPQRAITPGQAAVFYRRDEVLGGGTIMEVL